MYSMKPGEQVACMASMDGMAMALYAWPPSVVIRLANGNATSEKNFLEMFGRRGA